MDLLIKDEIYRFLFENSYDAILLTHPDSSIQRANPAACEMFQMTEDELCRFGRDGVTDPDDPRLEPALRERAVKGKLRAELRFRRKDGSVFPADCVSTLFKDKEDIIWTVTIIRDITAFKQAEETLRKAQEKAEYYAAYDSLTGILNRRAFLDKLQTEMARASRENTLLCLIILDIDHFKRINDNMGHACGDAVLRNTARLLAQKLRPYDILGRYGGDEFIICLPGTEPEEALSIAERLRIHIYEADMFCENNKIPVTISSGLVCHVNSGNEDADGLIIRADKNLYLAKQRRNSVFGGILKGSFN